MSKTVTLFPSNKDADKKYLEKLLVAVANGYPYEIIQFPGDDAEYWLRVDNPDYQPDDGSDHCFAVGVIVNARP